MMTDRLDDILKQALTPEEEPAKLLNQQILGRAEEEEQAMEKSKLTKGNYGRRRMPAAVLVAALVLGLGSVSALAAVKFLTPAEVTEWLGDEKLTEVFAGDGGIYVGETQSFGGYDVTFLGIASGKNISDGAAYVNGELREDRSYVVVSIAASDNADVPLQETDGGEISDFFVTPMIQGCDPVWYNAFVFGGNVSESIVDGVRYRLTECDTMEIFADRELYLGVMEGMSYNNAAYVYDEESGKIARNEDYQGLNALFRLPVDPAKADAAAAEDYLRKLREELFADQADAGEDRSDAKELSTEEAAAREAAEDEYLRQMKELLGDAYDAWKAAEDWYKNLTPENIEEYAVLAENTRIVLKPDADGYISNWDYEVEGRGGATGGKSKVEWLFKNADPANPMILDTFSNPGSLDKAYVTTMTLNGDGTVTFAAYIPKTAD